MDNGEGEPSTQTKLIIKAKLKKQCPKTRSLGTLQEINLTEARDCG